MIKAVIIDDELHAIEYLSTILDEYVDDVEIIGTAQTIKQGEKVIKETNPDLIFLDVELPDGTGFDLLDRLEENNAKIVMVTAYNHYAIPAIKARVADYLLKPVDNEELTETIDYLFRISAAKKTSKNQLIIHQKNKNLVLLQDDIVMIQSEGSYSKIHTVDNKVLLASRNLNSYNDELDSDQFFRSHRSYIINKKHLVSIFKDSVPKIELHGNLTASVSRNKKKEFYNFIG